MSIGVAVSVRSIIAAALPRTHPANEGMPITGQSTNMTIEAVMNSMGKQPSTKFRDGSVKMLAAMPSGKDAIQNGECT
ncbi:hypothetical protein Poly51_62130 [Rubripirellula tenax]|uniref:Uncharacterized protein n=1 Tax=Rubripirellula tenax TaxID=2528015 RepID=A0A5C6E7P5_9BACT|nr:hypothetical protein Poly51_62130 [Rubripirellula tenax]